MDYAERQAVRGVPIGDLATTAEAAEQLATAWLYAEGAGPWLAGVFGIWVAQQWERTHGMTLSEAKFGSDYGWEQWRAARDEYRRRECERLGHPEGCAA